MIHMIHFNNKHFSFIIKFTGYHTYSQSGSVGELVFGWGVGEIFVSNRLGWGGLPSGENVWDMHNSHIKYSVLLIKLFITC